MGPTTAALNRFVAADGEPDTPVVRDRILVVDDDPDVRATFQESLQLAGYDVVAAGGGAEALRLLRRDHRIGLVLLDLMMPEMDGWRFRHAQQLDARLAEIPTIIVSGAPLRDIVHGDLRASDYLMKPVGRSQLLTAVASYCPPPPGASR